MDTRSLPDHWDETRRVLHAAIQVLGRFRLAGLAEELPAALQYGVLPTWYGATTGPVNRFEGQLDYHFGAGEYVYRRTGQDVFRITVNDHSQTSLYEAVKDAFAAQDIDLSPTDNHITETTPFAIDLEAAGQLAEWFWWAHGMLARLKAYQLGPQTPVTLWPHGFDLSTLWFVVGLDESQDPQMNFGFSPGTADFAEPYFYCYAWPVPDEFQANLPSAWQWHTEWSTPGGLLPLHTIIKQEHPERFALDALLGAYQAGAPLLKAAHQA